MSTEPSIPEALRRGIGYQGFSLSSVCWGYRDIFVESLRSLFDQGLIGEQRPEVTERFFALMRCAEQRAFDHVLREFLAALNPHTAWILDLPGIFAEVTEMGRQLAERKLYYGVTYFRLLGEGGFGHTPQQVRTLMDCLHRLRAIDDELAVAFLRGYHLLTERLSPSEVHVFMQEGIRVYSNNPRTGLLFMQCALKTSESVIRSLTRECRLQDVRPSMERLLRALVGHEVEVSDLGRLDSDELIVRNTHLVCLYRWLYVPVRVRHFQHLAQNRNWYRLAAVVSSGMLAAGSFSCIHGHPDFSNSADLVGSDVLRQNLLQLLEYGRVLAWVWDRWPGARRLMASGVEAEFDALPPTSGRDQLLHAMLIGSCGGEGVRAHSSASARAACNRVAEDLCRLARTSVNVFDTAAMIQPDLEARVLAAYPDLGHDALRTVSFLPDFLYPASVSQVPQDSLIADLKEQAKRRRDRQDQRADQQPRRAQVRQSTEDAAEEQGKEEGVGAAFIYDEWSQPEGDYYCQYCQVHEMRLQDVRPQAIPDEISQLAARTRRIFELLRPEYVKERYLAEGDTINIDRLVRYTVLRGREPSPRVDFYEKPFRRQRDLAVLILLDVSGSTGQGVDREKTIEIEKRAALILGQGLSVLGDRFAVSGFSGNGREHCEFFIYKDFSEAWDRERISCVLSAYPRSATRIGAALRHAGHRLSQIAARQRLIVVITDGKPTDTGYDPQTRYAQHDVRMACVENRRQGIHTFCVSTTENSRTDMEIMFPDRMFAILPDIQHLPRVLPQLYIRMTV